MPRPCLCDGTHWTQWAKKNFFLNLVTKFEINVLKGVNKLGKEI